MTDLTKPDAELTRLAREVDRTRQEYTVARGEERDQCWKLYQRAMANYNTAVAAQNRKAGHILIEQEK